MIEGTGQDNPAVLQSSDGAAAATVEVRKP
jgi:hypothetical protein